jgi:phosphatidylglycerol:prolipoprotein diacylglycerol transferase
MKKTIAVAAALAVAAVLIYFFFAPVFRGQIILQPWFNVGFFEIRYYGLIMAFAILSAYFVGRTNAWRFGLGNDEFDRLSFWTVIVSFLSARLYFVLSNLDYFQSHTIEAVMFWHGGLSIFGAILGGLLFIFLYTRKKIYSTWSVLDLAAISLPLGQAIGRFGNFFNYEAYGWPTGVPWKMYVPEVYRLQSAEFYHPAFLYEAIGSLILFFVLLKLRGKVRVGDLALIYLMSYSIIRLLVESIRLDSLYLGEFKLQQVVAVFVLVFSGIIFFTRRFGVKSAG